MKEENQNVVMATENTVEQPAEEVVDESIELVDTEEKKLEEETEIKTYTEEELNQRVDDLLAKKIARERRKIEKEYQSKYSEYDQLVSVVNAGLGTENVKDATNKLEEFYKKEGINIPAYQKQGLSEREEMILANADADEIIESGEAEEEANRLASKGVMNMTSREKLIFNKLASHLTSENKRNELNELGLSNLYNDKKFNDFANQFNPKTSIKEIANLYTKLQPKPKVEQIGSLSNNTSNEKKDSYSKDEVDKMSQEEVEKNFDIIKKSMLNW